MKIEVVSQFFVKSPNIKFHKSLFSGNLTVKMCNVYDRQFWLVVHIDANSPQKGQMNIQEDKNWVQHISWEASQKNTWDTCMNTDWQL